MPRVIEQGAGPVFLRPLGHNQTTGHTVAEFVHPFFSQFIIFNLCFASRTLGVRCPHYRRKPAKPPPSLPRPALAIYGSAMCATAGYWPSSGLLKAVAAFPQIPGLRARALTPAQPCAPRALSDQLDRTCRTHNQTASGSKLTPLGQGGGSGLFESIAAVEMALVVEMVVDRGMDGGEFLQDLDVSEPSHCPFPSSQGPM